MISQETAPNSPPPIPIVHGMLPNLELFDAELISTHKLQLRERLMKCVDEGFELGFFNIWSKYEQDLYRCFFGPVTEKVADVRNFNYVRSVLIQVGYASDPRFFVENMLIEVIGYQEKLLQIVDDSCQVLDQGFLCRDFLSPSCVSQQAETLICNLMDFRYRWGRAQYDNMFVKAGRFNDWLSKKDSSCFVLSQGLSFSLFLTLSPKRYLLGSKRKNFTVALKYFSFL